MKPLQIELELKNNQIKRTKNIPNGVNLIIDGKTYFFKNAYLLPGFIDSHLHFFGIGENEVVPNFRNFKSAQDIVSFLKQNPFFRDRWIYGYGWNEENFIDKKLPDKILLDKAFPNIPVCVKRIDGHSVWVNSIALQIAGLRNNTNGILADNEMEKILKILPKYTDNQIIKMILKAQDNLFKFGVTEICDMDTFPEFLDIYKNLDNENKLQIRVHSYLKEDDGSYLHYIDEPYIGNMFTIDGVKFYSDGALGSHSAALFEPYNDDPNNYGQILISPELLIRKIQLAINHGFQIATHAIGDKANHIVLDTYHKILSNNGYKDLILRIEHCQMVHPNDLKKFGNPHIFSVIQPIHYVSDTKGMAQSRIGKRLEYAYPWRNIINNGGTVLSGSDAPIESPDPILGLDALVNSNRLNETLDLDAAVDTYTTNLRKLYKYDKYNSKILPFYNANFVILNNDLSQKSFKEVRVIATIANGKIVYLDKNMEL